MKTAKKAGLPTKVPRAVLAMCWALAALYWRTGRYSGATYAGLRSLLGVTSRGRLHALVRDAVEARVVMCKSVTARGVERPVVMLKKSTLTQLEALWSSSRS